jgi:hypothetical protein
MFFDSIEPGRDTSDADCDESEIPERTNVMQV